jgi:RNA-directed DNA polymerase
MGGRGDMRKAPGRLQDLQWRIDTKAKAEPSWRFWGLYVHVCKMETLYEAYRLAKANNDAPGSDGVTFEATEASGVEAFLQQIRDERVARTYQPMRLWHQAIPKDGGTKVRVLSMPTIRDRVVQGALKLLLEPTFEADFQPESYGFRPKRSVQDNTRVIDVDLQAYVDNVRHHLLLANVAQRVSDSATLHVLKLILRASGKQGVPQGGVISPWLSHLSLTEVDRMLERAKEVTRRGPYTYLEYARFADDLVILMDAYPPHDWLLKA